MRTLKTLVISTLTALSLVSLATVNVFDPIVRQLVPTLSAQTYTHNTTTLAAAQAVTDTTISLTSVSAAAGSSFGAVQAGQFMMVDQELEQFVSSTATSTIWNVQRRGARQSHASGAQAYIGPAGTFQATAPPMGTCVVANQPKFWILNGGAGSPGIGGDAIGNIYTCSTSGTWQQSSAPWYNGALDGSNGATVTLTAGQTGTTHLFDRAAGIIYTLPPPVPGMTFDFVYTVTVTSNNATVITNTGTVFVGGAVAVTGSTSNSFACNGTSHVKIQSNGSTTGGVLGGILHFVAVSSTLWIAAGNLAGSGTAATPCA